MSDMIPVGAAGGLARVQARLRDWMFGLALPFWADRGIDRPPGGRMRGACEHLTLEGLPAQPGYKRMRVQARQLYVFAEAAAQGVAGADALAWGIHRFMSQAGSSAEGGWARRLTPDGQVLDPAQDLYDLAFVLFALARLARLTGDRLPLRQAERTLGFLRARMARPSGGYANMLPAETGWRQQNPHMHLLEAALALFEVGQDARWAELAAELVGLFRTRLLEVESGTLGEYFQEDWRRAAGVDGDKVEPGHHAEWVWLLDRYETLSGESTGSLIAVLDRSATTHGLGPETGLVRDEIGRDGGLRQGSARLWAQTEMLRAHGVLYRRAGAAGDAAGTADRLAAIVRTADNLLVRYLVGAEGGTLPPGTWIDQLDAFGRPAIDKIPASSFYHIMTGWLELEAVRPPPSGQGLAA